MLVFLFELVFVLQISSLRMIAYLVSFIFYHRVISYALHKFTLRPLYDTSDELFTKNAPVPNYVLVNSM